MTDLLDTLSRESTIHKKSIKLENSVLHKMLDGFEKVFEVYANSLLGGSYRDLYVNHIPKLIPKNYSSSDITNFSLSLVAYQYREHFSPLAGLYLSALVQNCNGDSVKIVTENLEAKISYLGYCHSKKSLTIHGNVGFYFGSDMVSGELILKGDAGDCVGESLLDGTIIIYGNVKSNAGIRMKGGKLFIKGNALYQVGIHMQNGLIVVLGDVSYFAGGKMRGGEIIIRGSAKDHLGLNMHEGRIFVGGDTTGSVGYGMYGGEIIIEGNALRSIVFFKKGGKIIVYGRCDDEVSHKPRKNGILVIE